MVNSLLFVTPLSRVEFYTGFVLNNILDANATRRDHDSHALPIARFTARAGEWRGISTKAYGKQRISHLDDPQLLDPHSSTETRSESTKLGEMQFLLMLDLVVCTMLFETKFPFFKFWPFLTEEPYIGR